MCGVADAPPVVDALRPSPILEQVNEVDMRTRVKDVVHAIDVADAVAVEVDAGFVRAGPLEGDVAQ